MLESGNKKVVLIVGKPASGKTASLRNINREDIAYFNVDRKEIPFPNCKMAAVTVGDPYTLLNGIHYVEAHQGCEDQPVFSGGVIDTLNFAMDMYENQVVKKSTNTQTAWGDYAGYYTDILSAVKGGTKNYAILAHVMDVMNEAELVMESKVPIKGAIGKRGAEGDFSIILTAKCVRIKDLKGIENDLLTITEDEEEDGYKYVFQTRLDKKSIGEKTRSPMGLWKRNELYIDNDIDLVFKRLNEYYGA